MAAVVLLRRPRDRMSLTGIMLRQSPRQTSTSSAQATRAADEFAEGETGQGLVRRLWAVQCTTITDDKTTQSPTG